MRVVENFIAIHDIQMECRRNITLNQESAKRFFKTSKGKYSEHDQFLGITVPNLRKISKKYHTIDLEIVKKLIQSQYNEERLLALFILVKKYQNNSFNNKEEIYKFYLNHLDYVNNWNLVDASAHLILGHYLWIKKEKVSLLKKLAQSKKLWRRRISIVSTWYFIRQGTTSITFNIAQLLLTDTEDLIHKATGWMLREAGKKDPLKLIEFLLENKNKMPKTMLRYATEKVRLLRNKK
jgi:3-methyladenine DNA glycosylase AlkD